jgi:hypothetical protein
LKTLGRLIKHLGREVNIEVDGEEVDCKDESWLEPFRTLFIGRQLVALSTVEYINLLASISPIVSDFTTIALLSNIGSMDVH